MKPSCMHIHIIPHHKEGKSAVEIFLENGSIRWHLGTLFPAKDLRQHKDGETGAWYQSLEAGVGALLARPLQASAPVTDHDVTVQEILVGGVWMTAESVDHPSTFGRRKVFFGGPGRACDHGETWVYLNEIFKTKNNLLVFCPSFR